MKPKITLVFAVLLAVSPLIAQQQPFGNTFDHIVHEDGVIGAAYLLLDKGRIIERHAVGLADETAHQAVDANTIFHWASVTKTFTAVAIMQLRDRKKLSLDDPIIKYVPELARVHSEDNGISRITIRHLLSHTAGLQSPTWPYTEGKPWEPFEPTEWSQLVAMMPYQELSFPPGTKFQYSNPGFIYLARVIEALSGDPYEVYVQKNIFAPLEMTRTYFNTTPYYLAKDRARSYRIQIEADGRASVFAYPREFNTGITTANGGLNAPLSDMAKWIAFLSGNDPAQVSELVLARASLEEMWRPVVAHEGDDATLPPESNGYAFFLFPRSFGDGAVTFVGHTGHQAGFAVFFLLNPRNGRALLAALNTVHGWG
ncbi:MAG TPA: serine hydrolase domain-containing protein, partial [Candidatus Angelobacter sp.]|nr:serine hydrolase domain-containing protein [Candidatus Angelobacter sp.]